MTPLQAYFVGTSSVSPAVLDSPLSIVLPCDDVVILLRGPLLRDGGDVGLVAAAGVRGHHLAELPRGEGRVGHPHLVRRAHRHELATEPGRAWEIMPATSCEVI